MFFNSTLQVHEANKALKQANEYLRVENKGIKAIIREMKNKENDMSNAEWTGYRLTGADAPYEIVRLDTGQLLIGFGFKTAGEAQAAATKVAQEHIGVDLAVYGPLVTISADVPIKVKPFSHGVSDKGDS